MNILFASGRSVFSGKPVGGAETSMAVMAESLAKRGHNVFYFTTGMSFVPTKKMIDGVSYFLFKPFPLPFLPSKLKKKWHQKQIIHRLRKLIQQNDIQLAYCFGKMAHPLCAVRNKYFGKLKIMLRVAGITQSNTSQVKTQTEVDKNVSFLNAIDCLNYQSEIHFKTYNQTRAELGFKIPNSPVFIQDIGIHPSFFVSHSAASKSNEHLVFGVIMRFSARKRQDIIIHALAVLKHPNIKVLFIGDGPDRIRCEQLAKTLGVSDKCLFIGFLSRNKLQLKYREIDVLLHPVDYEPQSKTIWEAMAQKKIVVASHVDNLKNTIIHKKTGLLVDNKPEKWAEMIQELMHNYHRYSLLPEHAMAYAKNIADPAFNIVKYEEKFHALISEI